MNGGFVGRPLAFRHNPSRAAKVRLVVAILVALMAGVFFAKASPAEAAWNCAPGYCTWGYNYVGPNGLNSPLNSPYNYWSTNYLDKNSGGGVQWGTGPVDGCVYNKTGVGTWSYLIPSNCGSPAGYSVDDVVYGSGGSSYLYTKVVTGL
jgi:hypothetical protein